MVMGGQDSGQLHAVLFDCIQNLQDEGTEGELHLPWNELAAPLLSPGHEV